MAKLYLVRHAETSVNVEGRFNSGTVDGPLTARGIAQTESLARLTRTMKFDRVICSPLPRTVTTAKILVGESTPIMTDERLKEVDVGDWSGSLVSEHCADPEYEHFNRTLSQFDTDSIHAESISGLLRRGISGLRSAASVEDEEARVLVVSHGYLLTVVANYIAGVPLDETRSAGEVKNSSVSVLEGTPHTAVGEWKKLAWNVTFDEVDGLPEEQKKLFAPHREME